MTQHCFCQSQFFSKTPSYQIKLDWIWHTAQNKNKQSKLTGLQMRWWKYIVLMLLLVYASIITISGCPYFVLRLVSFSKELELKYIRWYIFFGICQLLNPRIDLLRQYGSYYRKLNIYLFYLNRAFCWNASFSSAWYPEIIWIHSRATVPVLTSVKDKQLSFLS